MSATIQATAWRMGLSVVALGSFYFVGVALHAYAAHNSDLGLDAHVRLNVVNDETNPGFDAPWGAPRVSGDASEPSAASFDGYVPPWNTTEASMKITAVSAC